MNSSYISPFAKPVYIMLKPVGSVFNLACEYCYYLEKSKFYPDVKNHIMTDQILEKFIKEYMECQTMQEVLFTWHGGETLHDRGELDETAIQFLEEIIEFQRIIHVKSFTTAMALYSTPCFFSNSIPFITL